MHKTALIILSLDAVLDTRLGTIARMDQELAFKIVSSKEYHVRKFDKFEGIDMEAFKKLYAERDVQTLAHSTVTAVMPVVKEMCDKLQAERDTTPYHAGPEVHLNVYPYELSEGVCEELGEVLRVWLPDVPIKVVNISLKELTPQYCKENVTAMFMYHWHEWMDANAELFEKTVVPQMTLFSPAIFVDDHTEDAIEDITMAASNPHDAVRFLAQVIVGLELTDVAVFSALGPAQTT